MVKFLTSHAQNPPSEKFFITGRKDAFHYQAVPLIRAMASGTICRDNWRPLMSVGLKLTLSQLARRLPAYSLPCPFEVVCLSVPLGQCWCLVTGLLPFSPLFVIQAAESTLGNSLTTQGNTSVPLSVPSLSFLSLLCQTCGFPEVSADLRGYLVQE